MKKRYQIDREDAVRQFRKRAEQSEESLQLHLLLKEVAAALQEGVGDLMRQAGLELMQLVMDEEVRELAGERYQRRQGEQPYRWGHEKGLAYKFARSGYALDSRRPHTLWSATAATAPSRGHPGSGRGSYSRRSLRPAGGRQRLTLKPEGEALLKLPSVRE